MSAGRSPQPMEFRFGAFGSRVLFVSEPEAPPAGDAGTLCVFDRHTFDLLGAALGASGRQAVVLAPGEAGKSWRAAQRVLQAALRAGLGRDGRIVGVGGGMVCDLAAFAASLYMRGCRLTLYPTSLLAMVDAALGGKTAVNLAGVRNAAGSFYPAEEIRIWIGALASLPARQLRSGLGEVLKTSLLGDARLLAMVQGESQRLLAGEPALLEQAVRHCLQLKAEVVAGDPEERGGRAVLNLGHTCAHALDSVLRMRRFTHGEAVAWGLARAAELSHAVGLADRGYVGEVRDMLRAYGFHTAGVPGVSAEALLSAMQSDKKRRAGRLRLVLQRRIGDTVVQEVEAGAVRRVLRGLHAQTKDSE